MFHAGVIFFSALVLFAPLGLFALLLHALSLKSYICMRNFPYLAYPCKHYYKLEDTARYVVLLLAPAEGFGRSFFCPSGKKRAFYAVLAHFWQFLVSSSNHDNI